MASQGIVTVNPLQPHAVDVEHTPLADKDLKIRDPITDFNLLELHYWSHDKFMDQADEIHLWESNFPKYVLPQTFQFPEIILCQVNYLQNERALISHNKEILFTITTESIKFMLQIQPKPDEAPFPIKILTKLYLKLDFPKRFQIFQIFFPSSVETPKSNPPYVASIFSESKRQMIVYFLQCPVFEVFLQTYQIGSIRTCETTLMNI